MSSSSFARKLIFRLRQSGLRGLSAAIRDRVAPVRAALAPAAQAWLQNKVGLEIGGPSRVFRPEQTVPVYPYAARIDNVNFASGTAWESGLREGGNFVFNSARDPGRQYLREATHLMGISDAEYDFILSSHCLEHLANPLAALREWYRVTREGGYLLLILPNPQHTFDHRRPITTLAHLRQDYASQTGENDLIHLPEILALHDLSLDPAAGTPDQFRVRSENNAQNRCLHHHVFDLQLMREILNETGWDVAETEQVRPMHLIALAQKQAMSRELA